MKKLKYKVTFTTPAFLGNAQQSGQWRTPPFKALLRQWWRVVYAADKKFEVDVASMRRDEGRLFGNAWLTQKKGGEEVADHRKSLVRMRLNHWGDGKLKSRRGLDGHTYLGYGPLNSKDQPTINAGETANLLVAVPEDHSNKVQRALSLMGQYGTIGGRSRNGWGSFTLAPQSGAAPVSINLNDFKRPLEEALRKDWDWPHAVGCDKEGLLIWETEPCGEWGAAMANLTNLRKALNVKFKGDRRQWLSRPVPGDDKRLPNSLRFKVVPAGEEVKALVFHMPCLPPHEFTPPRRKIIEIWQRVHAFLDDENDFKRIQLSSKAERIST